jgi:hypothetical protein
MPKIKKIEDWDKIARQFSEEDTDDESNNTPTDYDIRRNSERIFRTIQDELAKCGITPETAKRDREKPEAEKKVAGQTSDVDGILV